jgi:hypothetical protein
MSGSRSLVVVPLHPAPPPVSRARQLADMAAAAGQDEVDIMRSLIDQLVQQAAAVHGLPSVPSALRELARQVGASNRAHGLNIDSSPARRP